MSEAFDPYHKWLGIPPGVRPPDHYTLLGIPAFEEDADVISNAADRRMSHIKSLSQGPNAKIAQFVLTQLSEARVNLLNETKKAAYDEKLKEHYAKTQGPAINTGGSKLRAKGVPPWVGFVGMIFLAGLAGAATFHAAKKEWLPLTLQSTVDWKDSIRERKDKKVAAARAAVDRAQQEKEEAAERLRLELEEKKRKAAIPPPVVPKPVVVEEPPEPVETEEERRQRELDQLPKEVPSQFYGELDTAFMALLHYDYERFQLFKKAALHRVKQRQFHPNAARPHVEFVISLDKSYQSLWRMADAVIPELKRRDMIKVPGQSSQSMIVAAAKPGLLTGKGRGDIRFRFESVDQAGLPIYPEMPPGVVTRLAEMALEKDLLKEKVKRQDCEHGIKFFRALDPDALPPDAAGRWNAARQIWKKTAPK